MTPIISVVITCYNYGHYVAGCLESVLSQTFQAFEIIVVDDGSTDNTGEMVQSFLGDPRITYLKQSNRGQANAKNRGIREARGEFVAFLDADDLWEPDKLQKQLDCFDDETVGVVYSRALYIDDQGKNLNREVESFGIHLTPRWGKVLPYLLFDNFVPFSSAMVRRKLLARGFNENIKMAIDWELWLYLSLECRFGFVDEKLLRYRMGHEGQMSKNAQERFRCTDGILDTFLEKHGHKLSRRLIKQVLAHKYYLRWNYFLDKDPVQARNFLRKALCNRVNVVLILKGLMRKWLKSSHKRWK